MKYYTYNINTGWVSGDTDSGQLIAGYINADNEVALDLWVEKSIYIPASNTNVFQLQVDTDDLTSWQEYDVKIYYTLPSYVGHSAPLINDTNGYNWGEYISKPTPTVAGQHSYYLNIRAQETKKEFNLSLINSISYVNATYQITYKWTDSSGIQQEHSQYQSGTDKAFTPVDEGYPAIGYSMDWGSINNYIYNGQFKAKNLPYTIIRQYSIEGISINIEQNPPTKDALYDDILSFNELKQRDITDSGYRVAFKQIELQEVVERAGHDEVLNSVTISNIPSFNYVYEWTNSNTTKIKFIVEYSTPITFTIDYKLPRNSTYDLTNTTLPDTTTQTPESTLEGQCVETIVKTNANDEHFLSSTGKWRFKYLSPSRVEATPIWEISVNLPAQGGSSQAITLENPEETFYLCPNCGSPPQRVEYYQIYDVNYSPYFPYTIYDFKLQYDEDSSESPSYKLSLNFEDDDENKHKTKYIGNNAQPWPYFVYDQYGRPAPILDIMTIE